MVPTLVEDSKFFYVLVSFEIHDHAYVCVLCGCGTCVACSVRMSVYMYIIGVANLYLALLL